MSAALGWIYWQAYLGYFGVPVGSVDLGPLDLIEASLLQWSPLIFGIAAGLAIMELLRRWEGDIDAVAVLLGELKLRLEKPNASEEIDFLERETEALQGLVGSVDFRRSWPRWMRWLLNHLSNRAGYVSVAALTMTGAVAPTFIMRLLEDGSTSAIAAIPGRLLAMVMTAALLILMHNLLRGRTGTVLVFVAMAMLLMMVFSGYVNGRLDAYADWHSEARTDRFSRVVLYSPQALGSEWRPVGNVFASPEFLLITKRGDTYVVTQDQDPREEVSVIPSSAVVRATYIR